MINLLQVTYLSTLLVNIFVNFYLPAATDGFWDICPSQIAAEAVIDYQQMNAPTSDICKLLVMSAYESGSTDNITLILKLLQKAN